MGLFLKSQKTARKTGKGRGKGKGGGKKTPTTDGPGWDPRRTLALLKAAVAAGLVVAAGVGWYYGQGALKQYVSEAHAAEVTPDRVQLVDPPGWMTGGTRRRIRRRVAGPIDPDPLHATGLRQAHEALLADPVVRQGQVERLGEGQVRVIADYREPVAIIEARDGYHLVGPAGTRLSPDPYYEHQVSHLGLPLIQQVESAPPRDPGQRWDGRRVQAALSLIRLLSEAPYFNQIEAVDASQTDRQDRLRLVLRTEEGQITWGFPPGRERAIEPTAEVKLRRLRQLATRFHGEIDGGGQRIAINGATTQIRAPVQNAQAGAPDGSP
jgi:hypothetical protein